MIGNGQLTITGEMSDLLRVKEMLADRKHRLETYHPGRRNRLDELVCINRVLAGMTIGTGGTGDNSSDLLLAIQEKLDGVEWSSDTLEEIADIMVRGGYRIRDMNDVAR